MLREPTEAMIDAARRVACADDTWNCLSSAIREQKREQIAAQLRAALAAAPGMLPEHTPIQAVREIQRPPYLPIPAGTKGAIVNAYAEHMSPEPPGYIVEFFDAHGNTSGVIDVFADDVEAIP